MDPARVARILKQHVQTDRLLGADAVPLGETRPQAAAASPVAIEPPTAATTNPPPAAAPPQPALGFSPPAAEPFTGDKRVALQQMDEQEVKGCTRCGLHAARNQTVFGEGDPDADIMIIGEGPGAEEDRTGRPFVGRAGELLEKQLGAMGLTRQQVYIANAVKCRPPANRTPTPAEAQTCGDYLRRQVQIVQPKVILALGGPAAKLLLDTTTGITRLRGQWGSYDAIDPPVPVMPTFHPAYLLRSYTKENRAKVWEDLQAVMQKAGLA